MSDSLVGKYATAGDVHGVVVQHYAEPAVVVRVARGERVTLPVSACTFAERWTENRVLEELARLGGFELEEDGMLTYTAPNGSRWRGHIALTPAEKKRGD